ncbi:MAG: carboxypeptidase-like regulatory domain-containing protein [Terracidiphilus sp.]
MPAPVTDDHAQLPSAPEAQASHAQQPHAPTLPGSVHGVVVDKDGTVCEGAHVALVQAGAAATAARSAISASDGSFVFGDVPAGAFTLTVSSEGFSTQAITGLLHSGESYEAQPVRLLVASTASEVQVTASQQEIALEQFREETQQRVLGVIPNFYVSYAPGAPPLSSGQKFHLAWRSSIDPITFLSTGFFAGIEQTKDNFKGYGQGAQGYVKRFAANYADNFIGTMIGAAILPSLLKQDPRYFYKGTGSKRSRVLYAIAMSVVCKGDNGHWQGNYSAIGASFASAGISNLYYPAADRNGVSLTMENFGIGTAETAFQNLFQEFFLRRLSPKLPDYGSPQP